MKARLFLPIAALAACLASCDIERVEDSVEGCWQISDAKLIIHAPMGKTIEASSVKELVSGVLDMVKTFAPDEDFSDAEEFIDKIEDKPFSFAEEDSAFRLDFKKDGTFCSMTREDDGKWVTSDSSGEYSYAAYRLTLYFDKEEGATSTVPCKVLRITNKHLAFQLNLADMFDMPVGNPLDQDMDFEDGGSEMAAMLSMIELTTELNFNRVKRK